MNRRAVTYLKVPLHPLYQPCAADGQRDAMFVGSGKKEVQSEPGRANHPRSRLDRVGVRDGVHSSQLKVPLARANLGMPPLAAVTVRDRATQGGPGHLRSGPSPCPYSPKCVE